MKKLKLKPFIENCHLKYYKDIKRITDIFEKKGYELSVVDAVRAWEFVSSTYAAGWMILECFDDEDVFKETMYFLEEQ
jgi:hypothetical protein